jgi:hypothetical protein
MALSRDNGGKQVVKKMLQKIAITFYRQCGSDYIR